MTKLLSKPGNLAIPSRETGVKTSAVGGADPATKRSFMFAQVARRRVETRNSGLGKPMYPSDIRPLTSLRIAAALWVLVYHFRNHLGLDLERFGLIAKGYLGVDLFFILSGFILSHVYLGAWEAKRFDYGSFLWARLARVYPVHLVTLAAMIAIWLAARQIGAAFDPVAFDPRVLPQHLLLIHAWGTTPSVQWNFPSWSISAEWFAYLAFPAAALFVLAFRKVAWLAVVAAFTLFAAVLWALEKNDLPLGEVTRLGVIRIVPAFLMGAALYQLGRTVSLPRLAALVGALAAVIWIVVASMLKLGDLAIWPAFALLIFSLAEASKTNARGVLGAAGLVYLGEVSYAVYMTHLPVDIVYFQVLGRIAPTLGGPLVWAAWAGVFGVSLATSVVAYHLVETPARNWMRARDPFSRKPRPEPPHEPVL